MLQFKSHDVDHSISNEQMSLECLELNGKENSNEGACPEVSQWLSGASDNVPIDIAGRKSFIRTPTKLASAVAYPFTIIKPLGARGDVTLKEINQRILTPPPSKPKKNSDDPSAYPKSAFTGKPVVGKTRIRTEGGKGSITIMRTKG
ncbi:hypothetical protein RIF29_29470 [Crotalaria pallida]|uniref:Protein XRI1-like n=1 Tax=Crotalaria pallida TaxID=3830 RepID=A0AAN9ELF2_CROPI